MNENDERGGGVSDKYDYQPATVRYALDWLANARPGDRLLVASPTGTGKSYMEWDLKCSRGNLIVVTPKLEIVQGFLEKAGIRVGNESDVRLAGQSAGIWTPISLRNALVSGELAPPAGLVLDEAHHDLADSWQDLHLLCGFAPVVGFTATPFRGTPRSTAKFREMWGEPVWAITFREAVDRGVLSMPTCETWPLVDDDEVEVRDGELVVSQVEAHTVDRLGHLASMCARFLCPTGWDRPTIFACPTREVSRRLAALFGGLVAHVDGETPYDCRQSAFAACLRGVCAISQVQVVSEGVDLPVRRLIDLSPCLSPVKWLQQLGRVTRPSDVAPEYVCANRNVLRHGYLLDGCLPESKLVEAQEAFGGPGTRSGSRCVGMEAIGRLRGVELHLRSGLVATCYSVSHVEGHVRTEYFAILHPNRAEPTWARKESTRQGDSRVYGRWVRCDPPTDLRGFASVPAGSLSEKQKAWWQRSAERHGLAPVEVNRRVFQALPVLADIREVL